MSDVTTQVMGLMLAVAVGFALGWWARGRRSPSDTDEAVTMGLSADPPESKDD